MNSDTEEVPVSGNKSIRLRREIAQALPLAPDYFVDELVKFEQLVGPFFPDLAGDHAALGFEMEWLWTRNSSIEIVSHSQSLKNIDKLEESLRYIVDFDFGFYLNLASEYGDEDTRFFLDFIGELNKSVNDPDICEGPLLVTNFIAKCKEAVKQLPDKKNIKWDAVLAVDALRVLWWRNTGRAKEAPIYLNAESKFAEFLRAGFNYLEVDADVNAAFRSWRTNMPRYD